MDCILCDKPITNVENESPICDECLDSAPILDLKNKIADGTARYCTECNQWEEK